VCIIKPGRILYEVVGRDAAQVEEALVFALRKLPVFAQIVTQKIKI